MKKKEEEKVTKFFQESVSLFFSFFEKKFGFRPSFDGSAPRDLKMILDAMRKRSEEKSVEWTLDISQRMLEAFLETAYNEVWLKDNFLLFNLNRQKDKLFFKIKNRNNGTSKEAATPDGLAAEFKRRYSS